MKYSYRNYKEDKIESLKLGILWMVGAIIPCMYPAHVLLNRSSVSDSPTGKNLVDQFDLLTIAIILVWSAAYFILGFTRFATPSKTHNNLPLFVLGWIIGSTPLFGFIISFTV